MRSTSWAAACVGLALVLLVHFFQVLTEHETYLLVEHTADAPARITPKYVDGTAQVLHHGQIPLTPGVQPHLARTALPSGQFRALTLIFDPVAANVSVTRIRIRNAAGTLDRELPLDGKYVRALNGMQLSPRTSAGGWDFQLQPEMQSPSLVLLVPGEPFGTPPIRWLPDPISWLVGIGGALLFWGGATLIWRRGCRSLRDTWDMVESHPKLAIVLVGGFAALISFAPVFTDGRGLVGPYQGGSFLYDAEVTFPGQGEEIVPPFSLGVDVAALMYTAVGQMRQAAGHFWQSGELMLWDRFNSGGATYLGQGMWLYLCPYIWPVLLLGGTVASWTWAFLLAKISFTTGIGLYLRRQGIRLPVVLATAAACAFLGAFVYRTGHFAYFALSAAPLFMLGLDILLSPTSTRDGRIAGLVLWLAACSACFCGGAVKEAVFVLAAGNFVAMGLRFNTTGSWRDARVNIGFTVAAGLVLVLLLSPVWLSFLQSLQQATTIYDEPEVVQKPVIEVLSVFDGIFGGGSRGGFFQIVPSLNLLFLPGTVFAVMAVFISRERWKFVIPVGAGLICMMLAVKIIPGEWFLGVPFFQSILSFYNTFGLAALPALIVAAALGWNWWWSWLAGTSPEQRGARIRLGVCTVIGVIVVLGGSALVTGAMKGAQFYPVLAGTLVMGIVLFTILISMGRGRFVILGVSTLGLLLCVRFAYFSSNYFAPWGYVLPERVAGPLDSRGAMWLLEAAGREPARMIGVGNTLKTGANTYFGLEGISGAMPLRNAEYWQLLDAILGIRRDWIWVLSLKPESVAEAAPFLEFLNCRYVVGMPGQAYAGGGPPVVHSSDLEVRELPLAWPRAFFVDQVRVVDGVDAFVNLVNQRPGPFCAVSTEIRAANPRLEPLIAEAPGNPPEVVPARDYELTLNNTSFTVEARGPGMIVLHEAFEPGVFQVRVNGQPAELLRVNHAFRGLQVPAAGTYRVEYRYWPPVLTVALWMSVAGGVLLVAFGAYLWLSKRDEYGNPPLPDTQPGH